MHRLLAEYLRLRSNSVANASAVCLALLAVQNQYPPGAPKNWPLLNLCFEHVKSIVCWRPPEVGPSVEAVKALEGQQIRTGGYFGLLLDAQGRLKEGREWAERMHARSVAVLGPANVFTVLLASQLADARSALGHEESARDVLASAVTAARSHDASALTMAFATVAAAQGGVPVASDEAADVDSALPPMFRLMNRAIEGADLTATEPALGLERQRDAIDDTTRLYGSEALLTLKLKELHAMSLAGAGELDAAIALQDYVVGRHEHRRPDDQLQVASSLLSLASIVSRGSDKQRSLECQQRAWRIRRRLLGKGHQDTLKALSDLAFTISLLNDHQRANRLYARLVSAGRRALGDANPLTLEWAHWQAWQLTRSGDRDRAIALRLQAIGCARNQVDANHEWLIELKRGLLKDWLRQGAHLKAHEIALELTAHARAIHGERSKEFLIALETAC